MAKAVPEATIATKVGPVWEHINFQFQPSQSDACSDVLIDVVMEQLDVGREDAIAQIEEGYGTLPYTDATYGNRNADSLNRNLKFRQALAYAIDKQAIVDDPLIAAGLVPPLDSDVDAFNPSLSQDAWKQYAHDPARAAALLQELRDELGASFPENRGLCSPRRRRTKPEFGWTNCWQACWSPLGSCTSLKSSHPASSSPKRLIVPHGTLVNGPGLALPA